MLHLRFQGKMFIGSGEKGQSNSPDVIKEPVTRLSQDQMEIFVSLEVIFQGCLSDFILCFLKSTDEAVSENVYIGYNILYNGIYFY